MSSTYEKRGVSAGKSDVHNAIKNLDKGLFPNAFCKILPDIAANDPEYCTIMHADTAGTKTSLAYLYWRETGDISVWKGIVQDALVMNLDDMACAGAVDNIIISSTIGRNKKLIPGEVVSALINGAAEFIEKMQDLGVNIHHAGGETADVGDIVRTADVGFTAFARFKRSEVVDINIQPGDVCIGLASYGQASYEDEYNSGIGSNGLTFARHETLSNVYASKYPETFDPSLDKEVVYTGKQFVTDEYEGHKVGKLLLSPTRTYLPFLKELLKNFRPQVNGIVHCTGGGASKVLHFMHNLQIIKDNLLPIPPVFKMIREQTGANPKEMYQVFNMGQRLEIYVPQQVANEILDLAASLNIQAQVIGHCEKHEGKKVTVKSEWGEFAY